MGKFKVSINVDIYHNEIIEAETQEEAERKAEELYESLSFDDYNGLNFLEDIRVSEIKEEQDGQV